MSNICVFCGSRFGKAPEFRQLASELGSALAEAGHTVVYGGGRVGLMGAVADAARQQGGQVIGVIPEHLKRREVAHPDLQRLEVVPDMLSRKQRMIELSDAFINLPGGLGTLDELFEVMTWWQLGLHHKPMLLLDQRDYYAGLIAWLESAESEGFIREEDRRILHVRHSVSDAMGTLKELLP